MTDTSTPGPTGPRPYPDGIGAILEALEPEIKRLAMRWSKDSPDDWEDLAQEARVGIYQELKQRPDSPKAYLFQRAKHEILDYRKRGKSVDGRLHKTFKRKLVWALASLDVDLDEAFSAEASLYFRKWQASPIEDLVISRSMYGELRKLLTATEAAYLSLMLQGHLCLEANALLGLTCYKGAKLRKSIRAKARNIFVESEPPVEPGAIHFREEVNHAIHGNPAAPVAQRGQAGGGLRWRA